MTASERVWIDDAPALCFIHELVIVTIELNAIDRDAQ